MTRTLGLIGSGNISAGLARLAVAAGLDVVLSNSRGPETLAELVAELGDHASAATAAEAAQTGDIVVATIPLTAYTQLPVDALAGKIVIDTMNYYPDRIGHIAELDDSPGVSSSALVQRHLTAACVVKAFNNIDFRRLVVLARPAGAADRSALPIAGDDAAAKQQVTELLDTIGFDTVDLGTLADSWRSEPGTPVSVTPYLGAQPEGLSQEESYRWFLQAPGLPVSGARVKELLAAAVHPAAAVDRSEPALG